MQAASLDTPYSFVLTAMTPAVPHEAIAIPRGASRSLNALGVIRAPLADHRAEFGFRKLGLDDADLRHVEPHRCNRRRALRRCEQICSHLYQRRFSHAPTVTRME